jgi:hypothetical protein
LFSGKLIITILTFIIAQIILFLIFKLRGKHKVAFAYLLNFIIIISVLSHFEIVFKFRYPEYVIENLYTAKRKFYINKKNLLSKIDDKEYNCVFRTNCQGIRVPESFNSIDSIPTCDWLFIGDSYTQGAQVNFDQLYTSQLYKYFPDRIIVNYGVSGLGIPEELELYKYLYPKLKPTKVFLQLCNFNDFMNVHLSNKGWQSKLVEISDLYRFFYFNLVYKGPSELPIGRWAEPFCANEYENTSNNIFYKPSNSIKERDIQEFENYLIEFKKETIKNGVDLIIILIPTKEQIYYKFLQEVINGYHIDINDLDMSKPNRLLKRLTDSLNIKFIDLYDSYTLSPEQVFFDFDEHLNTVGHSITAKALTDTLNAWGLKSSAKLVSGNYFGERYGNYSQDKSLLTYQAVVDGNMEIFISDTLNQKTKRITINQIDDLHPMLSQNNTKVVFTEGNYQEGISDVFIQDINGTDKVEVSNNPGEYGAIPVFSRSNKYIAYCSWTMEGGKISKPQILVYNTETGIKTNITNNNQENWRPSFSPDETKIAYISRKDKFYGLHLYDLDRHVDEEILLDNYDIWDPSFSADNKNILYSSNKNGNWDLFEYNLYSKQFTQLTETRGDEWDPFYISPDDIIYSGEFGPFRCIYKKLLKK